MDPTQRPAPAAPKQSSEWSPRVKGRSLLTELRVISLIASATEILHALDGGHLQVARSHECDYPESVLNLPQLTRAKFKVAGATSAEIDRSVRTLVAQGMSVYEVDGEAMRALAPDVILTQDQCEVCAVSLADVERAVCSWTDRNVNLVSLRPHSLEDVAKDIVAVSRAIGRPTSGQALVRSMHDRFAAVRAAVADLRRPRIAFIEWIDPPMSGGHWMPELIDIAGGENLLGEAGKPSPWINWTDVCAVDPDVLLVAPCGYDIATSLAELDRIADVPHWAQLRAVRAGAAFVADGNAFFNRPGPRLVESCEILAEILHPDTCNFGHRGRSYVTWPVRPDANA